MYMALIHGTGIKLEVLFNQATEAKASMHRSPRCLCQQGPSGHETSISLHIVPLTISSLPQTATCAIMSERCFPAMKSHLRYEDDEERPTRNGSNNVYNNI